MTRAAAVLRELTTLPFGTLDDIVGPGRPLILAPHPDDESLGCGGLIAACCARGTPPYLVVVTDGSGSHPGSRTHPPQRLQELRAREARAAIRCLGMPQDAITFLGLPDAHAPTQGAAFDAAVGDIVQRLRAAACTSVLAPWGLDPHCDHEAVDMMARAAGRIAAVPHLAFPVWGWTLPPDQVLSVDRVAGWRLDIAAHQQAKRDAIAAHRSQHAGRIKDDPAGFRLPANLLAALTRPDEVFLCA